MSTQNDSKFTKIVDGMVSAGVPRGQAVAVAMAIDHALQCPEFMTYYGTYLHNELTDFVETVHTS